MTNEDILRWLERAADVLHENRTCLTDLDSAIGDPEATIIDFDVREISSQERHTTIFARFDTLRIGQTLRLIFDQQPRLLQYQLLIERPGMYEWEPERQEPETWIIRLRKTSSEK